MRAVVTLIAAAAALHVAPELTRGAVTAVRVAPAADRAGTVVAVHVGREVTVQDFVLTSPRRVVVDIAGATLAHSARAYDHVSRGGVTNVRLAQFRASVVRVVVELDGPRGYEVRQADGEVRIVVKGDGAEFAPWQSGPARPVATVAAAETVATVAAAAAAPAAEPAPKPAPKPEPTVEPKVEPKAPPTREPAAATRAEPARRAALAPRITVTYSGADIHDVIAAFAAFSGRTIIVGREVDGKVTAEVKEQPWDVALNAILRSQGLAAAEDASGIIMVDSYANIASTRAVEPLVTRIFEVNYAKASSLMPILHTLLSRDCGVAPGAEVAPGAPGANAGAAQTGARSCLTRGSVTSDSATNKLLITDVPSHLPQIAARLQELDVRTPQVAIKAKIIFVNRTGLEDIGVSYDLGTGTQQFFNNLVKRIDPTTRRPVDTNGDGVPDASGGGTPFDGDRIAVGGNALSALANADRAMSQSALNLIYSATIGRFQLTTFLNALQQTSLADVQSEPSIVTLNNRTAEIFVGQQIPIRVIDASAGGGTAGGAGGGAGNFPRATVRLEEAGIKLKVTPQVTNNRKVVLTVSAENSNAQVGPSEVGVVFNRQRADNQLLVGDGETAVIGGLTVTETSKTKTGIPFLVDLPLIGRLFGQTTTSEVKRDLLVLITPHILDEGESAPAPAIRR